MSQPLTTQQINNIRADFPILNQQVHGLPLVYLDSAATSQKPKQVIEAISRYYETSNANVHRGVHRLSDVSTLAWEHSRARIAAFLGATSDELIVVRNTTEAMNGITYGWGIDAIQPDDVVLITELEHHSNFVVWQQLAARKRAHFVVVNTDEVGRISLDHLRELLTHYQTKVRVFSFVQVSNTLGVEQPMAEIVALFNSLYRRDERPKLVVDVAQAAPHQPLNFDQLDLDFMVFSGHKMLGPMGFGGLLVRHELLAGGEFHPWLFGGGMISSVAVESTEFHPDLTERFTAGTPDVASAVGMAAACEYLFAIGMKNVEAHDRQLVAYALDRLNQIPEISLIGPVEPLTTDAKLDRLGSVAFIYKGVHAHDVAQILDSQGVAVRSGHHCTMPLHQKRGWQATVRASFQVYTTTDEIDALVDGLAKVKKIFLG